jgi:hypothetical protein
LDPDDQGGDQTRVQAEGIGVGDPVRGHAADTGATTLAKFELQSEKSTASACGNRFARRVRPQQRPGAPLTICGRSGFHGLWQCGKNCQPHPKT